MVTAAGEQRFISSPIRVPEQAVKSESGRCFVLISVWLTFTKVLSLTARPYYAQNHRITNAHPSRWHSSQSHRRVHWPCGIRHYCSERRPNDQSTGLE